MRYSVISVSLPDLDLLGQAKLLSSLGYDGLELRVRRNPDNGDTKPGFWGFHHNDLSPENLTSRAAEIRQVLSDHNLALAGLASYVKCTDLEEFKLVLEGAVAVGASAMRVGASAPFTKQDNDNYQAIFGDTVAGYARCIEIARGSGVKLLLETHGGTIHTSASLALRIVSNFSPSQAGIIFDPNNMVSDGFETTGVVIPMLGEYIGHCHIAGHRPYPGETDENGTVTWKWECCSMAEGLYDFPEMLRWLKKIDYQGFISVEDYRADLSSEYRCREAIEYLKKIE
ncbi:MAG: sugar phosphate isomerase/epimerase [Oligosphaeraceae bacterium]|nr:sugar phosphate isomerase/epimerase [Oligosphaeraceae bacterium]